MSSSLIVGSMKSKKTYQCAECNKLFNWFIPFAGHIAAAHGEKKICKYCEKEFAKCGIINHEKYCLENPANGHVCNNPSCNNKTNNKKYCSVSCSNAARKRPIRKSKTGYVTSRQPCPICSKEVRNNKSGFCMDCMRKKTVIDYANKTTIAQATSKSGAARHRYSNIRNHARRFARSFMPRKECKVCGYDTYVELYHIISIGKFPTDTKLSIVNSIFNLVWLCPNHHKEMDLGILKIEPVA